MHEQTAAGAGLPGKEVVDYPFVRVGGDGVTSLVATRAHGNIGVIGEHLGNAGGSVLCDGVHQLTDVLDPGLAAILAASATVAAVSEEFQILTTRNVR